MTFTVYQKGKRPRAYCANCRKAHEAGKRRQACMAAERTRRIMDAIRLAKRAVGQ